MKTLIFAGIVTLGLAGAAIAQDTTPATPMQGSPPTTNTPAPATSPDSSMGSMGSTDQTNGSMTAPATKPMAGTNTNPTDSDTSSDKPMKHKKPK